MYTVSRDLKVLSWANQLQVGILRSYVNIIQKMQDFFV